MSKKVIFVQGTAFSGSTFFHLMLANDPGGFACGEVHGLFRPHKPNHVNREHPSEETAVWQRVLAGGEANLYASIFALNPDINCIVDSSKQPFWIRAQNEHLRRQNIPFHNILIWKKPLDFASSKKRRKQPNWDGIWLNTHRMYLSFMTGIRSVRYEDMAKDQNALQRVCEHVEIPYFPGKERYWEKQHYVLGGSETAKAHLIKKEEARQRYKSDAMTPDLEHKTVQYKSVEDPALEEEVARIRRAEPLFDRIEELLNYTDISNADYDPQEFRRRVSEIAVPWHMVLLKHAKYELKMLHGRYRYRNAPRFASAA